MTEYLFLLSAIEQKITQADRLNQAGRIAESEAAFRDCLALAARQAAPLFADHLVQIWMGLGFCCADRGDLHGALEWYHRAEAVILSAPLLSPDPATPEAKARAEKWAAHVPDGVTVIMRKEYAAELNLAILCESMAFAYDNSRQPEPAQQYYQRSFKLYRKLGDQAGATKVYWYQAIACQRRQEWLNLEHIATRLQTEATHSQNKPLVLAAQRFLVQAQLNQQRLFKALDHFGQAVVLGRELHDRDVARDEGLFQELVADLRPEALQRGQAAYLEPLVRAEAILNDPNLAQDQALLASWQH